MNVYSEYQVLRTPQEEYNMECAGGKMALKNVLNLEFQKVCEGFCCYCCFFFFVFFLCARGERKVRVLGRYNVLTAIDIEMIFCDLLI